MDAPIAKLRLPEPVVIPESVEQCYELLGQENVVGMGDFASEAGFTESVLLSTSAFRALLGDDVLTGPTKEIPNRVVDALREVNAVMRRYPGRLTPVIADQTENGLMVRVLIRQNLAAHPPFTLITLD